MKIRTKSGEVYDLAELRQIAERGYRNTWPGLRIIILLDALEAALGVQSVMISLPYVEGREAFDRAAGKSFKAAIDEVRQAAGVVESEDS